ncbi:MAG: YceI family protein [Pseudomonadota bacterium]
MRSLKLFLATTLALAAPATAAEWQLNPEKSVITFTYFENETAMEGVFPTFEGEAFYDPAWQNDAVVEVRVRTADVQMPDFVRTAYAKTPGWFHTQEFPEAILEITALEPFEDGKIRAIGELTLKGETFPMQPIFTLEQSGKCLRAQGDFEMALSDYGIGAGAVSRLIQVQDRVVLSFDLTGHLAFAGPEC